MGFLMANPGPEIIEEASRRAPLGLIEKPITPEKLWRALQPAQSVDLNQGDFSVLPVTPEIATQAIEGGLAELCDEVWLVTCEPAVRLERVVGRGQDPADAEARIAAQGDIVGRLRPAATRIIDTSRSVEATRAAVEAAFQEALTSR